MKELFSVHNSFIQDRENRYFTHGLQANPEMKLFKWHCKTWSSSYFLVVSLFKKKKKQFTPGSAVSPQVRYMRGKHASKHWEFLHGKHFSKYQKCCLKILFLSRFFLWTSKEQNHPWWKTKCKKAYYHQDKVNCGWLGRLGSFDSEDWSFFVCSLLHMQIVQLVNQVKYSLLWTNKMSPVFQKMFSFCWGVSWRNIFFNVYVMLHFTFTTKTTHHHCVLLVASSRMIKSVSL